MAITRLKLERFTAFESLDLAPSPGINVLVGANGTGKTHLMKIAYAACDVSRNGNGFAEKLVRVFLPAERSIGRLVKRQSKSATCAAQIFRGAKKPLEIRFSSRSKAAESAVVRGAAAWSANPIEGIYIPVREMLANAPGFRSLYSQREIHFEEIHDDILARAYTPALKGPLDRTRKRLLGSLQKTIAGKVNVRGEAFFLRSRQGNLEFPLLAEGMRKIGLLWLLIQNGTLQKGTALFWDEPETNLNPGLFGPVVDILLELQRMGVQVFAATHDYAILKELDLRREASDHLAFHALYRESDSGEIACRTTGNYPDIHPNAIAEAFADLHDREVERSLGRHGK